MIAVLDYGIGNLRSAEKALQHVGADARLVTGPAAVEAADGVVLPGVGAFGRCMTALRESGLDGAATGAIGAGVPFLGICIGMQMLYESSEEAPDVPGLAVFRAEVRALPEGVKRPQMQWNVLQPVQPESPLLDGLGRSPWVYFVHSYAPDASDDVVATCDYGGSVVAAVERGNVWATQFHPEKSGANGLRLLSNFVARCAGVAVDLFPAIDLRGGKVVRLTRGDFGLETVYGDDPVAVAKAFEAAGAPWIHVVDLDGALTREPLNREAVLAVRAAVSCRLQSGGGVRDASLLDAGIDRVVLGTAAVEEPALVGRLAASHKGRVAVGLDVRDGELAIRGWTEGSGQQILEALGRFEAVGVAAFVVTEIGRDGTLAGPDVDGLRTVLGATHVDVVASGGVGTLDDLRTLAGLDVYGRRLAGVIVGRALYEGRFTVEEAIAACAPAG